MPSDLDEKDATNATVTPATPAVKNALDHAVFHHGRLPSHWKRARPRPVLLLLPAQRPARPPNRNSSGLDSESRNYSFLSFLSSSVLHRLLESHSATPSGLKFGARNSG